MPKAWLGTLPPMMQVMRDIGGVELPSFMGKLEGDSATPGTAITAPAPALTQAVPAKPASAAGKGPRSKA